MHDGEVRIILGDPLARLYSEKQFSLSWHGGDLQDLMLRLATEAGVFGSEQDAELEQMTQVILNGKLIPRDQWRETEVKAGDRAELLMILSGG